MIIILYNILNNISNIIVSNNNISLIYINNIITLNNISIIINGLILLILTGRIQYLFVTSQTKDLRGHGMYRNLNNNFRRKIKPILFTCNQYFVVPSEFQMRTAI